MVRQPKALSKFGKEAAGDQIEDELYVIPITLGVLKGIASIQFLGSGLVIEPENEMRPPVVNETGKLPESGP